MAEIDILITDVKNELKRIGEDTKKQGEEALKQAKQAGDVSLEVKNAVDKLLSDLTENKGKLADLEARQLEIEQKGMARPDAVRPAQSLGTLVTESDEYKAYQASGKGGSARISMTINQAITSTTGGTGSLIAPDRETDIVGLQMRRLRIRDLLTQGSTTSNLVQYPRMVSRTNGAAVVSETTLKPQSGYTWQLYDAPVRTIAHWVPISRQALDDAAQLKTEVDSELRYGLAFAEEAELLKGDGTGQHLSGLMTNATAYVQPSGVSVTSPTQIDRLRLAILQLQLSDLDFDGFVLNPIDWANIELLKDSQGRYLWANPMNLAGPTLWGVPVVATAAMDDNAFLTGMFKPAATIYDRLGIEVLFSTEDQDNFVKNMVTARAEERLALAVKRPFALVKGTFS